MDNNEFSKSSYEIPCAPFKFVLAQKYAGNLKSTLEDIKATKAIRLTCYVHYINRNLKINFDIIGCYVSRLNTITAAKSHVQPIRFPRVTYNDMTKPEGPWQEKYEAMNAEYSKYMYLGIFSFVLTFGLTLYTLDLFKYMDPPHKNTPEGLAFLNPNPDVLADIQK